MKKVLAYGVFAALTTLASVQLLNAITQANRASAKACLGLRGLALGSEAIPFELPNLSGGKTVLSAKPDKLTLLHFWFTRCPPCIEELPSLLRLARAQGKGNFRLLTVSVDEDADTVRKFLAIHGLADLPVAIDPQKTIPQKYGTTKYPESYLIDHRGTVRYRFVNKRNWASPVVSACFDSLR